MKVLIIIFSVVILSFNTLFADFEFAGNIKSASQDDNRIEFTVSNCLFNLYVVDENIIRFRFTNQQEFSKAPSYAVIYEAENIAYDYKELPDFYEIKTKELLVKISKNPCRITISDKAGNILNEDEKSFGVSFDEDEVRNFKTLFNDELFFWSWRKNKSIKETGWTIYNVEYGFSRLCFQY